MTASVENAIFLTLCPLIVILLGLSIFALYIYHKRHKPESFIFTIIVNLAVTSFLLAIVFLLFEAYFRFIYDSTDSLLSTRCCVKWFQKYYHTNKSGFRDDIEYEKDIPYGKTRITFLGDSFTAGHGIKNIENRFVNIIRGKNSNYDVHMLAIPGFGSKEELDVLEKAFAEGYKTDIVVLVYFLNDIIEANPYINTSPDKVNSSAGSLLRYSFFLDHIAFQIKYSAASTARNYYQEVDDLFTTGGSWERHKKD